MSIEAIISVMQNYYTEHGKDRPIEYTYGFFDALSVLRIIRETIHE